MNTKHGFLLIVIALLLLIGFVGTVSANTWYVDDDGGADFKRIQDAINAQVLAIKLSSKMERTRRGYL